MNDLATIPTESAQLPSTYVAAKQALAECDRVDECKDMADKAAALASYAKQAEDDELMNYAKRIRARATRRCGELLKQFDAREQTQFGGVATDTAVSQREVAEQAGLSKRQQVTAVRVASVPEEQFEALIEADSPATVTQLANIGKAARKEPKAIVEENKMKEATAYKGPKINVPQDRDLVDLCRQGIARERDGEPTEQIAEDLGLAFSSYRTSRQIVMLADMEHLSDRDRATMKRAMDALIEDLQSKRAWEIAEPVAEKVWGKNWSKHRLVDYADKRMERFAHSFDILIQTCLTTDQVDIPYLSTTQIAGAKRSIAKAKRALHVFEARIKEIQE